MFNGKIRNWTKEYTTEIIRFSHIVDSMILLVSRWFHQNNHIGKCELQFRGRVWVSEQYFHCFWDFFVLWIWMRCLKLYRQKINYHPLQDSFSSNIFRNSPVSSPLIQLQAKYLSQKVFLQLIHQFYSWKMFDSDWWPFRYWWWQNLNSMVTNLVFLRHVYFC